MKRIACPVCGFRIESNSLLVPEHGEEGTKCFGVGWIGNAIPPMDINSIPAGFAPIESEGDLNPIGMCRETRVTQCREFPSENEMHNESERSDLPAD